MVDKEIAVDKVRIPLKQHIGVPATPVVEVGADVQVGDLIGAVEKDKVGANVHASIDGKVTFVSKELIEISARG
jgi:Na+-translocating ferredoxin:NAD+ oxidoreductase RnfC subunit